MVVMVRVIKGCLINSNVFFKIFLESINFVNVFIRIVISGNVSSVVIELKLGSFFGFLCEVLMIWFGIGMCRCFVKNVV